MTALRKRIVQLRRDGKSRRQIKEILGPMSNSTLDDALKGEPPPEWTRRARAKDDLRERARELRVQGLDYEEIAYRGCLRIDVSGSADLYRKIEGWATASMDAAATWTLF
ncbi:MAG TPA: hypothetical protein VFW50_20280 [Streptosporangiaceae bacterium]|nr:hypothetical protein [Streptosporangiaceae bacterium]